MDKQPRILLHILRYPILAGVVLCCTARGALAAEPDLFALSLEELINVKITVASLIESDDFHAPSHVSVITADDWQRYGARRTVDALSHLPATQILPVAFGYDAIAIRGYASTASTRGIATSLDGVRLNNFSFGTGQSDTPNINLGVLDRIEMIRGPASAVHGNDAFHGVLALHAFESGQDLSQASAEAGEGGFYQTSARYSGQATMPLRLNLALAASGQSDQDRNYEYGAGNSIDKEQRYQSRTASLKFVSDPGADIAWRWGIYADEFDAGDFPTSVATHDSGQETSAYFTRLAVAKKLAGNQTLEASGYYRTSAVDRRTYLPPGSFLAQVKNHLGENAQGMALTWRQPHQSGDSTQWAASLGYDVEQFDEGNLMLHYASGAVTDAVLGGVGKDREIASLVVDADTRFADGRWGVVYGGRVDQYSDFGSQLSPRAGLIFLPTPDTAVKLLYGRAFRAPTVAELYFVSIDGTGYGGNPNLDPETIDALELVLMWRGQAWQGDVGLFENRWQDAILLDLSSPSTGDYINSGRNRAQGVETSWTWLPQPWRLEGNVSYTHSQNVNTDQDYRLFPRFIANLLVGYELAAINTRIALVSRYFSGADDVPDFGFNNPQPLAHYLRTDLNLVTAFGRGFEGYINLTNLLDRDNHLPSVIGLQNGIPDEPLGISIGVRWADQN